MADSYPELVAELYQVLTEKGAPPMRLLERIDAVRGNRPRPFGHLIPQWQFLPGRDTPSALELARRELVATGLVPATAADLERERDRERAKAEHEAARLKRVAERNAAEAALSARPAIFPS